MTPNAARAAFRTLHHRLARRRLSGIETRLKIEIGLLALLVGAFLFWQARVSFASMAHDHGPARVARVAAALGSILAIVAGARVAMSHARRLRGRAPGPAWLALPIPMVPLLAHLEWEARAEALWVLPMVPAILIALAGLVPAWWIGALGLTVALSFEIASRAGLWLAFRATRPGSGGHDTLDPLTRRLAVDAGAVPQRGSRRPPRWRRVPRWRALWNKDLLIASRPTPSRRRALAPLALAAGSVAVWWLPIDHGGAHALAFGLALFAAGTFGEWLIGLAAEDPFSVLRALPLSLADGWWSRVAWAVLATAALAIAHALAARPLAPPALALFLVWIAGATLATSVLAIHYAITLYPRTAAAQRVYSLTLGIAIAASLMIPLMGWFTLAAALVHSTRRLSRWWRLEEPEA